MQTRKYITAGQMSLPDPLAPNGKTFLPIFIILFTVKFRNDLRRKLELKLPHPLKSVATLPCEM